MELGKPIVGVVLTMLELYRRTDPERPAKYASHWQGVLEELMGEWATLRFTGVSHTAEEVEAAVHACEDADCDMLVVLPMSYAPSGAAMDALTDTSLPLVLVDTARDATLPYDMGDDHIMANHAMHGVQDLANVLGRNERDFELVVGHPSEEEFRQALLRTVRASAGARVFRKGQVGRIGQPFEDMLDFHPGEEFENSFDLEVAAIDPDELLEGAQVVTAQRISDVTRWVRDRFAVDAGLTSAELEMSVRWSLALEDLVERRELDAVSMNFLELAAAGAGTMPFLGASRLMSEGVGYAGEGDVVTAALMAAMAGAAGEATFTEMFCPDYARSEVLLSHMGECNFALARPDRPVRLVAKPFVFGDCARPAVPVFQLKPGLVTLASFTQWPYDGYRIVATTAEVLDAPEHPNLRSPHTRIGFGRALPGFLEDYSRAGGTHHLALAYGDLIGELNTLAGFLDIGLATV